jgi:ribonuclease R
MYSPDNVGHFGLAYESYTHFTSPIRRYPDLLVHRAIKAVLAGAQYKPGDWEQIGLHCSATERRADEATRDVVAFLKCYFMQDRVGETFIGSVSAVVPFGLFVALDDIFIEGLLHVSELGTDYFHYDETRHAMLGERSGKQFRLSDRVKVQLVRVDMATNKIDFRLIEGPLPVEKPQPAAVVAPAEAVVAALVAEPAAADAAVDEVAAPPEKVRRTRTRKAKPVAEAAAAGAAEPAVAEASQAAETSAVAEVAAAPELKPAAAPKRRSRTSASATPKTATLPAAEEGARPAPAKATRAGASVLDDIWQKAVDQEAAAIKLAAEEAAATKARKTAAGKGGKAEKKEKAGKKDKDAADKGKKAKTVKAKTKAGKAKSTEKAEKKAKKTGKKDKAEKAGKAKSAKPAKTAKAAVAAEPVESRASKPAARSGGKTSAKEKRRA